MNYLPSQPNIFDFNDKTNNEIFIGSINQKWKNCQTIELVEWFLYKANQL